MRIWGLRGGMKQRVRRGLRLPHRILLGLAIEPLQRVVGFNGQGELLVGDVLTKVAYHDKRI